MNFSYISKISNNVKFLPRTIIYIILFNITTVVSAQNVVSGELVDKAGHGIDGAAVVVMNAKDSISVAWGYSEQGIFRLNYNTPANSKLLLYIEAYGFNSLFREIPKDATTFDIGTVVMDSVSVDLNEITVTAYTDVKYRFVAGEDKYEIPKTIGEQAFDLNALLSHLPGLAIDGDKIIVIGRGAPEFTINGMKPRPGELAQLSPRDIEKVSVNRMPSSRYSREVKSVIDIVTRKSVKDYINMRVTNDFRINKEPRNNTGVAINSKAGRWVNYLGYSFDYGRNYYETVYKNILREENKEYERIYSQSPLFVSKKHSLTLSPKYQISDNSFVDVQYRYIHKASDNSHPETFDITGYEKDKSNGNSTAEDNNHDVIMRYKYSDTEKNSFDVNIGYSSVNEDEHNILSERIFALKDNSYNIIDTEYNSSFYSQTANISANYEHKFKYGIKTETGGEYALIWDNGTTKYKNGADITSETKESQAALYLNAGQEKEQFSYMVGLRWEYLYKHNSATDDINAKPWSYLPSVSFSYQPTDNLNFMLYFRSSTVHPTIRERDPILHYVNKYEYTQGNPNLKSYIENELAFRVSLPYNFYVALEYDFADNPIVMMDDIYDIDKQQTVLTYHNFPKRKNFIANLGWHGRIGFYSLSLDATYDQCWARIPFGDSFIEKHKPKLGVRVQQRAKMLKNTELRVVFNYLSSYNYMNTWTNETYNMDVVLTSALFKNKLNFTIACYNVFYNNERSTEQYKHISTYNFNRMFDRQFRVGLSYKFNNYRNVFQRNESNSNILDRLK